MKRGFTKILASVALAIVFVCSMIFATGCQIISGVKMKDLVGTYEMTSYGAKTNVMEEREIKMYMVINSNGSGYYVFKDNDTEVYAAEMRVSFTANTEDSSKYDYVKCTFYDGYTIDFGVNRDTLNYSKIVWKPLQWGKPLETDYTISVGFKKVSKKTDLSYVQNKLDVELMALPFGLSRMSAVYELISVTAGGRILTVEEVAEIGVEEPIYAYIALDVAKSIMEISYMFTSENEQKGMVFVYTLESNGNGAFRLKDSKGGDWELDGAGLRYIDPTVTVDGNQLKWEFSWSASFGYDLTETIRNQVLAYNPCFYKGHEWVMNEVEDLCAYEKVCTTCGVKEGMDVAHIYDDENDAYCNTCGVERQLLIVPPELKPEDENSAE